MGSIPKIFYDYLESAPISSCKVCKTNLLDPAQPYMIEKAFRRHNMLEKDTIMFEMAICLPCAQEMRNELSVKSRKHIESFMAENMDQEKLFDKDRPMFEECLISGVPIVEEEEYQIYGYFLGEQMIEEPKPYALSGTVVEQIADLLSDQTIDFLDDFMGKHFGIPPEYESAGRKLIFV